MSISVRFDSCSVSFQMQRSAAHILWPQICSVMAVLNGRTHPGLANQAANYRNHDLFRHWIFVESGI